MPIQAPTNHVLASFYSEHNFTRHS